MAPVRLLHAVVVAVEDDDMSVHVLPYHLRLLRRLQHAEAVLGPFQVVDIHFRMEPPIVMRQMAL